MVPCSTSPERRRRSAVWISGELESDIAPFALREIFRVLKPGGRLDFASVVESTGLDLRRALLAARIAFDEGETPTDPVYSCSLRKNGARSDGVRPGSDSAAPPRSPDTAPKRSNAVDPRLAPLENENRRQIALVRDMFVGERQKLIDEVLAVVDDAVERGFGEDGWIWISNRFAEGYSTKFFLSGWHGALDWVIWDRDDKCVLMLPYPAEQSSCDHAIELQLHLALPGASAANPITIGVRVNDGPVENFNLSTDDEILTVLMSTALSKFRGASLIEFHLGAERSPRGDERPGVDMRMGVRRLRYRGLEPRFNPPPGAREHPPESAAA
jgi:hypothetical protein